MQIQDEGFSSVVRQHTPTLAPTVESSAHTCWTYSADINDSLFEAWSMPLQYAGMHSPYIRNHAKPKAVRSA